MSEQKCFWEDSGGNCASGKGCPYKLGYQEECDAYEPEDGVRPDDCE